MKSSTLVIKKFIYLSDDDIAISDNIHEGTLGLWEHIMMKKPKQKNYTDDDDFNLYENIMVR